MDPLEFLRAVKDRNFSAIDHYSRRDLDRLNERRQSALRFVIQENQNRRAPTANAIYRETRVTDSTLNSLVRSGYLYDPNIVDIAKVFFFYNGHQLKADGPINYVFADIINGRRTRSGKSWRKRMQDGSGRYTRYFFAPFKENRVPVYWTIFYQDPPRI